ncbi:hypothetical protein JHK85_008095 [Glycine max]|nr:hypothetical protein JHK85_008095 [Glycine max]KAG5072649.1 hypothetical protein JHK86_007860 [Glycine max]
MAIPFELYYNIENDIELIEEAEEYGTAVPSPRASHESQNHDVRKLYASQVVDVDEESQKRIRSLEAKYSAFESKVGLDARPLRLSFLPGFD